MNYLDLILRIVQNSSETSHFTQKWIHVGPPNLFFIRASIDTPMKYFVYIILVSLVNGTLFAGQRGALLLLNFSLIQTKYTVELLLLFELSEE